MNFDSRSLLAIAFCIVFYMAYTAYLSDKYPDYGKPPQDTPASGETAPGTESATSASSNGVAKTDEGSANGTAPSLDREPATQIVRLSQEELTIATDTMRVRFDQDTGGVRQLILKDFMTEAGPDGVPINLTPEGMWIQGSTNFQDTAGFPGPFVASRVGRTLAFSHERGPFRITQSYTVPEKGYAFDLKVTYENISDRSAELNAAVLVKERIFFSQNTSFLPGMPTERPTFAYRVDGSSDYEDIEAYCSEPPREPAFAVRSAQLDYFGVDRHYFLKVLTPDSKMGLSMVHTGGDDASCRVAIVAYQPQGAIKSGESASLKFTGFFGPKDFNVFADVDSALNGSVDYGIFAFIAEPLLMAVQGFHSIFNNYGVAIVIMTVLLKILFYPLMKASSKSMHAMKKLNPQMQELREKYKDDRQKQQQELMKFMSQHKINPAKGCLPILPQIPVFFAFYQVLLHSIELRHAPFFGWIQDLTAMDPYFVTPLLMGVAMFIQQKLTPTTGMDKTQEKVMMMMPIIFTAMMLTLPSGLTLYMLTNTIISIAQQKWLYYKLDKLDA